MARIILASESPRRKQLLADAGIDFVVVPAAIAEDKLPGETPVKMVMRLAAEKARTVAVQFPGEMVLAADTVVALAGRVFGKPTDRGEAKAMIQALSGRTHAVHTGVCLHGADFPEQNWVSTTKVTFRKLDEADIDQYLDEAEPFDKAGAYAIQENGGELVAEYDGLYSNVVGLPIEEVLSKLQTL